MPILILLLNSIIVGVFFLLLFVFPSVFRGLFRKKEEYNTAWKRFFNEGRPFILGGVALFIWGLLGFVGVLLNYSFDKQHGVPTYYTDTTLIYGYLPSLVTAIIGLISWVYFKSLRKKKTEKAIVAEPVEEGLPKKASHVVSVKVRKVSDGTMTSSHTPPAASNATTSNVKTRYCKYCGGQIDLATKQCSSCGKQYFHIPKAKIIIPIVCVAIIAGVCVGYFAYNNARSKQLLSNAMEALETQQFSVALSYFNELPSPETNYPDEYAYTMAGILYENGDYLGAYDAFYSLDNPPSFDTFMSSITKKIYDQGVNAYRSGDLTQAKKCFTYVEDYEHSSDYLFLIRAQRKSLHSEEITNKLIDLLYFEDAGKILASNAHSLMRYLSGNWKSDDGYYFEMDGGISTNLPKENSSGNHLVNNGIISISKTSKKLFKFSDLEINSVTIYCYKDNSSHVFYREGSVMYSLLA